jgi:hypothetical protein
MSYARVVWFEGEKEYVETLPASWVCENHILLPKDGLKRRILACEEPGENWMQFKLKQIRVKGNYQIEYSKHKNFQ